MKSHKDIFISAIVVAGGKGTRMNMEKSKQYIEICGVPVLARTLKTFEDCSYIDEIIIVVNSDDMFYCKQNIVDEYAISKVKVLAAGGVQRQNSVYNGLCEVCNNADIVIIHDGARPFVKEQTIIDCIEAAVEYGVSTAAVPVKDTIKSADEDGFVDKTLERSVLWAIQTPQAFEYDIIKKAHDKAIIEGFTGTDDTVLSERLGVRTRLVMGSYENIKITTREDLLFGEAIINKEENEE